MNTKKEGATFCAEETEQVYNVMKNEFGFKLKMEENHQKKPFDTIYMRRGIKDTPNLDLVVCVRKYLISLYCVSGSQKSYILNGQLFYGTFDMVNYLKMNVPFCSLIGLEEKTA